MRMKYGNRRTRVGDRVFASKVEADYGRDLQFQEQADLIGNLEYQPVVKLVGGISYRPDFAYFDLIARHQVWVEVKGVMTDRFRLIKKLWKVSGPGPLLVVRRQGRKGWDVQRIVPETP